MHYDLDDDVLANVYLVPPVRYPDGHHYLKLGANTATDQFLTSTEEMQAWYRDGDSDRQLPAMRALVQRLFPGLTVDGWHTGRCVITRTPHQLPMIDTIEPGLSVAVGGNGSSAACADALGELAAELVHRGGWHDELAAEGFAAVSS
jgi:sarcosine oxidase